MSTQDNIQTAAAGDHRAFAAIVEQYRQMVWRVALRMLGDPDEAEDAVQETFIRAWKALPGFAPRYSPATEEYCNWFNECYYREYCRVLSSGTGKRLTQQEEMDVIEKFRESLDFFDGTATVNSVSVIEAARLMDTATGGTAFSEAAADHADRWAETLSAREEELLAPFIYALRYTVTMPGRLTSANTALMDEGIPVWKVDGFRLLAGDLTIEATSSRANPLGFILLGLIVLVSAVVFFRLRR